MGDNTLFFYGTLMHPSILSRVIHGPSNPTFNATTTYVQTCLAILPGYSRRHVRKADYPAIIPDSNTAVRGTLARNLTDADVRRLDIFEGDEYARAPVEVQTMPGGETVAAHTYVWIAPESRLEESEWDFDAFVKDKMRFWLGGETGRQEFGELDAAIAADGTGGRAVDGEIGRELEKEYGAGGGDAREAVKSAV